MPTSDSADFFRSLPEAAAAKRLASEHAQAAEHERERPRLATRQALHELAHGTEKMPIGDELHDVIRISPVEWATLIQCAVAALAEYPGLAVVRDNPIRVEGLGFEAAARVWRMALDQVSKDEIARAIRTALETLGHYDRWPWSNPAYPDSSDAFWAFFKQVEASFETGEWRPPSCVLGAAAQSQPRHVAAAPAAAPPSSTASVVASGMDTLADYEHYLITMDCFRRFLARDKGMFKARDLKPHLPSPVWSARRCRSWYRVRDLINALPSKDQPAAKNMKASPWLRHALHAPDEKPSWHASATNRP